MDELIQPKPIRTFELVVTVTHLFAGTLDNWPPVIQDGVMAALERLAARVELPLKIVASRCAIDDDYKDGEPGRFYVHVIASEIVMADERTIDPRRIVGKHLM